MASSATFLYAVGFIGNLVVPKTMDSPTRTPFLYALGIDVLLLGVFAVQHSVMARPWFKRAWTRVVPEPAERSTYVLLSSLALIALFAFWQPLGGTVWDIQIRLPACQCTSSLGWGLDCADGHVPHQSLRLVWFAGRFGSISSASLTRTSASARPFSTSTCGIHST